MTVAPPQKRNWIVPTVLFSVVGVLAILFWFSKGGVRSTGGRVEAPDVNQQIRNTLHEFESAIERAEDLESARRAAETIQSLNDRLERLHLPGLAPSVREQWTPVIQEFWSSIGPSIDQALAPPDAKRVLEPPEDKFQGYLEPFIGDASGI